MTEVKLEGTEELLQNLHRIDSSIRSEVALKAVKAGAYQIFNRARINSPVKTSALRNSMQVSGRNDNGKAEAEISVNVVYARIQEFGGTIHPIRGKYLRYKVDGQWRCSRQVTIRGKHYLGDAIESEKGAAVDAMSSVIKSFLE